MVVTVGIPLDIWGTILYSLLDMPVIVLIQKGGVHTSENRPTRVTTILLSTICYTVRTSQVGGVVPLKTLLLDQLESILFDHSEHTRHSSRVVSQQPLN